VFAGFPYLVNYSILIESEGCIFILDKTNLTMVIMMDVAITKMSSKGQVVIPYEMRKGIKEGEKLVIIHNADQFIMKKAVDFGKNLRDDLLFAKRTEEALKKYEAGEFVEMDFDEFLEEAEKW